MKGDIEMQTNRPIQSKIQLKPPDVKTSRLSQYYLNTGASSSLSENVIFLVNFLADSGKASLAGIE